jgi:hypothetical protein
VLTTSASSSSRPRSRPLASSRRPSHTSHSASSLAREARSRSEVSLGSPPGFAAYETPPARLTVECKRLLATDAHAVRLGSTATATAVNPSKNAMSVMGGIMPGHCDGANQPAKPARDEQTWGAVKSLYGR